MHTFTLYLTKMARFSLPVALMTAVLMKGSVQSALLSEDIEAGPGYQELWFNQTLDHFNPTDTRKWQHRFLPVPPAASNWLSPTRACGAALLIVISFPLYTAGCHGL
jgi:hypothetical protein